MQFLGQWAVAALLVLGGMGLTVQAAVNTRVRGAVGSPVWGALISILVSAAVLGTLAAFGALGRGRLAGLSGQPWWIWTGGLFGAVYLVLATVGVPRVGAAVVVACAVLGQVAAALVLDSTGWLGVPRAPLNGWRVLGGVLILAGVLLVQMKK